MPDDLNAYARTAYLAGMDPVAYAECLIEMIIQVHRSVTFMHNLDYWGGVVPGDEPDDPDLSTGALACRIVGHLLDAGWRQPGGVS